MRSYTVLQVAKLFSKNIKMIPRKLGERKKSAIIKKIGKKKIFLLPCKTKLSHYVKEFKKNLGM